MTTYTTIADADIDQDSPVTQPLMTALRDNPIAMAEGAAGAPSVLGNIAANSAADGIGTYVFAVSTTASDVSYGNTRAGSALRPTSAIQSGDLDFADPFTFAEGSALSGTWRCMGTYDYAFTGTASDSGKNVYGATLWLRIS